MSYITSFNNQIDNFLDYIIGEFPDETNFILFKNFILKIRKINSIQIVKNFMEYLEPHKDVIYSEDDNFFLEFDFNIYGNDASKHSLELKNIYVNCKNDEIKKNIWKYLQVLLKLGEKANLK